MRNVNIFEKKMSKKPKKVKFVHSNQIVFLKQVYELVGFFFKKKKMTSRKITEGHHADCYIQTVP